MSHEAPRTEDLPTVLFGLRKRDPKPFQARHGRLLPGERYSRQEFTLLEFIAAETLPTTPVPSLKQLARIAIKERTGCWELPSYRDALGEQRYGSLVIDKLDVPNGLAYRAMYLVFYGENALPNGRQDYVDHLCENKTCCYPRHLEAVTPGTNTARARAPWVDGQLELAFTDEILQSGDS